MLLPNSEAIFKGRSADPGQAHLPSLKDGYGEVIAEAAADLLKDIFMVEQAKLAETSSSVGSQVPMSDAQNSKR